jgi:putative phosphoribosyl transferase
MIFENREQAARLLARRLNAYYRNKNPLVLAIPRGAVPMAKVIAHALGGELDVILVHKLGHPLQPELAIGAIDENGSLFLAEHAQGVDVKYLEAEKERQVKTLRRRRAQYTPYRSSIDPRDRFVIVVDDGIATGSTMTAALRAVRARNPKRAIAAVAVASPQAARAILREADGLVCLKVPTGFYAVGQFFVDFAQVTDDDVVSILQGGNLKASAAG